MASIQEPGIVRVIGRSPNGREVLLWEGSVSVSAPGGGAPDGVLASAVSIDRRLFVPIRSDVVLTDNSKIYVEFTADGPDGIDVSDCIWDIPITTPNGVKFISRGQFTDHAPADYNAVAGVPVRVGGYKITEGRVQFGGGPLFIDMQDDTA